MPSSGDESQVANVRYFVEKCNQVLGTAFVVPNSERIINVEWLLRAIDVVYPVVHVQGRDLKEPYDYHTQLLASNLHSSASRRVVDKNIVDDVLMYMIQFRHVCTCDMECYDGVPYDPTDPNGTKSGKYGACVQTCPNSTCNCNCNCRGACECPCFCQCECREVRNGNTRVCPCNCEVASENCLYQCECNCNCPCHCPCDCDCPSQCVGPTCDTCSQMPKTACEEFPNGINCITYCQTTCATNPDGTKINGNCGTDSKSASTCPYGEGNNGTPKPGSSGSTCNCKNDPPGTGGNTNDYQCACACACGVDNCMTNCGTECGQEYDGDAPLRECLTFCPTINCDED